jgi:hypothetical protein
MINDLLNDAELKLKNKPVERPSLFQMKFFILGKESTVQSKLWKCLSEIKSKKESIELVNYEIEEQEDNLKEIDLDIKDYTVKTDDRSKIKLSKLERKRKIVEKSINALKDKLEWISQELNFYLQAYNSLEKLEPLRDYDDLESQKEYWNLRLKEKLSLKMISGSLGADLIESIMALPDDMEIKKEFLKLNEQKVQAINNKKDCKAIIN